MPDPNLPKATPQFTTAEYSGTSGGDRCAACNQPITTRYYRVNNKIACEGCVQQLQRQLPQDSHAAYVRGLLFGLGAAIVGMIFYAGFTIVTGIYIGYVSLAVGWLIGKAIMLGSPEYFQRAGSTNLAFLQALYHTVLNRALEPAGQSGWSAALAQEDRATVAAQLLASPEAEQDLVAAGYLQYLRLKLRNIVDTPAPAKVQKSTFSDDR